MILARIYLGAGRSCQNSYWSEQDWSEFTHEKGDLGQDSLKSGLDWSEFLLE